MGAAKLKPPQSFGHLTDRMSWIGRVAAHPFSCIMQNYVLNAARQTADTRNGLARHS
jgi:hypothetical protein